MVSDESNDILGRPHVAPAIAYPFCGSTLYHGERDDSEACFCGAPYYLHCARYLDGEGSLFGAVIYRSGDDGSVQVALRPSPPTPTETA